MIDVHAALLAFLEAELSGVKIYAGRSEPPVGYRLTGGDCIVFRARGGGPDYDDALLMPSVQFKCYGTDANNESSELASFTLYRSLYDALHNGHDGSILHAQSETLGQLLDEPDTGWYYVLAHFQIMVRQS